VCTLLENTEIVNFVLLGWEERNSGRYEHARARHARHTTQSFTAIIIVRVLLRVLRFCVIIIYCALN
jgi:hypothetical protein